MAEIHGVRIVKHGPRQRDVDVFDLETGEKLTNVYAVELVADAATAPLLKVRITADIPVEYEGPAEIVTPEEDRDERAAVAELQRQTDADVAECRVAATGRRSWIEFYADGHRKLSRGA